MFLEDDVSDKLDLDPNSYNEAIFNKDSKNWQSVIKVDLEFMDSKRIHRAACQY